MRLALLLPALLILTRCGGMTDYTPQDGSPTSFQGAQSGAGVQAPIWSDDPNKKTMTNQSASP